MDEHKKQKLSSCTLCKKPYSEHRLYHCAYSIQHISPMCMYKKFCTDLDCLTTHYRVFHGSGLKGKGLTECLRYSQSPQKTRLTVDCSVCEKLSHSSSSSSLSS